MKMNFYSQANKLIFTTKVLFLPCFESGSFWNLEMAYFNKEDCRLHLLLPSEIDRGFKSKTSNNQSLQSAGDNNLRSKRFCSIAMCCASFT